MRVNAIVLFRFKAVVLGGALAALASCGGGGGKTSHIIIDRIPILIIDIALDDLDGDDRVDLVLARSPFDSLILKNSSPLEASDLTFTRTKLFSEGYAQAVVVADIDGDGKKDLAVGEEQSVHLLIQTSSGSFDENATLSFDGLVGSLSMVDLDRDGRSDLVAGVWSDPVIGSQLLVQFQRSEAATFEPPVELPTSTVPHVLCDVDGDGWGDVVSSGRGGAAFVVFRQDPGNSRTFFPGRPVMLGERAASIATGDFDDDGRLDVAFTGIVSRRLWICLQDPREPGAFGPPIALHTSKKLASVVSGDLNGDGAPDLVVGAFGKGVSYVLLRDPRTPAAFQRARKVKAKHECRRLGIADMNGDAKPDIVCAGDTSVSVLEQRGTRALKFHARVIFP